MARTDKSDAKASRREVFGFGSAVLAAATLAMIGGEELDGQTQRVPSHNAPNDTRSRTAEPCSGGGESGFGMSPSTDSGTVKPFKYSFALARKRVESGGWTRQVTVRELPVSKTIAGVEMRLTAGGV